MLSYAPPPTQHVHIQTDGDYTKRVATPFGTTRLKMANAKTEGPTLKNSCELSVGSSLTPKHNLVWTV